MKRRYQAWAIALAVLGMAGTAWAMSWSTQSVSVTATNQTVTVTNNHSGGDSAAFSASQVILRSDPASANTCYFDPTDGVATTDDEPIAPGASFSFPWPYASGEYGGYVSIGVICAGGQTATWRITAIR
jgi:hypothetical protein